MPAGYYGPLRRLVVSNASVLASCPSRAPCGPLTRSYRVPKALYRVQTPLMQSRGLRSVWSTAPASHCRRPLRVKGTPRLRRGRRLRRRPLTRPNALFLLLFRHICNKIVTFPASTPLNAAIPSPAGVAPGARCNSSSAEPSPPSSHSETASSTRPARSGLPAAL